MSTAAAEIEDISSVLNAEFRKFLITWRKLVHLAVQGHQPDEQTISQAAAMLELKGDPQQLFAGDVKSLKKYLSGRKSHEALLEKKAKWLEIHESEQAVIDRIQEAEKTLKAEREKLRQFRHIDEYQRFPGQDIASGLRNRRMFGTGHHLAKIDEMPLEYDPNEYGD